MARKPGGQTVDRISQPGSEKGREGGERTVACLLPKKSPGLDSMESKWIHGKRKGG